MKYLCILFRQFHHSINFILQISQHIAWWFESVCNSKKELDFEIVALRSHLALYQLQQEMTNSCKPQCTPAFRLTWILLVKVFAGWKGALCVVKPETEIRWHRQGFRVFWRYKSRSNNGRPSVSAEIRKLIRKINAKNPLWSPERIYDQLVDLGFQGR